MTAGDFVDLLLVGDYVGVRRGENICSGYVEKIYAEQNAQFTLSDQKGKYPVLSYVYKDNQIVEYIPKTITKMIDDAFFDLFEVGDYIETSIWKLNNTHGALKKGVIDSILGNTVTIYEGSIRKYVYKDDFLVKFVKKGYDNNTKKPRLSIFVVGKSNFYANFIPNKCFTDNIIEADLVLFTGGEDISPSLYGDIKGTHTNCDIKRDENEIIAFDEAEALNKPMLGICRGAQFLCVMAGGKLVQHQPGASSIHSMITSTGKVLAINSLHHQAQYPYNLDINKYELLGYSTGECKHHYDGNEKEMPLPGEKEAEVVYYPEINALGIQHHPEMIYDVPTYKEQQEWVLDQIENKLKIKIR